MIPLNDQELQLIYHHMPFFSWTFFRDLSAAFADHDGLSKQHVHTILFLKMNGPSPMSKVARFLDLEKGSFTPIANRLIGWGYVTRENDDSDRRRSLLSLTDAGRDFSERLKQVRSEKFSAQIEKLSTRERRQLFTALASLQQLMQRMNDSPMHHPFSSANPGACTPQHAHSILHQSNACIHHPDKERHL